MCAVGARRSAVASRGLPGRYRDRGEPMCWTGSAAIAGKPPQISRATPVLVLSRGRLEELDEVSGGVGDQDLASAGAGHQVAAQRYPRGAEPLDLGVQVVDDEVDAVAAGCGGVGRRGAGS